MDKYEFNLKVEQIKKLAARKEYQEAAKIAKAMNWQKVKDWSTLATVLNVQEAVGDYEEARDMAILAYNRNLGGRKLVYKLTELLIKVKDFDNAEMLYEEYAKASQHDVNRYILLYNLRKAQKASDNELVEILEEYKEKEIDEKYMYELAKLYYKTNRKEECIKTCDNIVLWFQDGIYVEKSVQLKNALNGSLTGLQRKILDEANNNQEESPAKVEEAYAKQQELAKLKKDDIDDALNEDDISNTVEYNVAPVADRNNSYDSHKEDKEDDDFDFFNEQAVTYENNEVFESEAEDDEFEPLIKEDEQDGPISIDLVQNDQNNQLKEFIINAINTTAKQQAEAEAEEKAQAKEKADIEAGVRAKLNFESTSDIVTEPIKEVIKEAVTEPVSGIDKASSSLKELIENAKKQINDNYEQINRLDEEEDRLEAVKKINAKADSMDIEVDVPNYNIYDTQNLQLELAKNLSEIFEEEDASEDEASVLQAVRKDEKPATDENNIKLQVAAYQEQQVDPEDEQIEGQMNIMDWIQSVKEEKYGKQHTKEYSKTELERLLDEQNEKNAAYEKLIAKQKAEALEAGKVFDEKEAKRNAEAAMILNAVKTDLAIRTGRASVKLEEYVESITQHAESKTVIKQSAEEVRSEKKAAPHTTVDLSEVLLKVAEAELKADSEQVSEVTSEEISLVTAKLPPISNNVLDSVSDDLSENDEETDKKLTGELAKIFKKYREMPGIEAQLVNLFDSYSKEMAGNTSATGNIIISGNSSSDKTDLARSIVRAINYLYPDKQKKLAKTTGESINQRGIAKAMTKLKGTALIVEGAGVIQPKRVNEIINCLEQDTNRMIVIFEDSDAEMNVLLNFNPELTNVFNYRIVLKQYTVNEYVEMAKRFARKRQYEVDDDALLELYLKIDKLHGINDNISLDDIKEIINKAIENSERRASRKFFGGLKRKRGENGEMIFLTDADFKDR